MNKEDIINIMDYWCNLFDTDRKNRVNTFNCKYEFFPLTLARKIGGYIIDSRMYFNEDIENTFDNCRFIKKNHLLKIMSNDLYLYTDYCQNTNITAIILWKNHKNKYCYFIVWLYSLCVYINTNKNKIEFCNNTYVMQYINDILEYINKNASNDFLIDIDFKSCYKNRGNVLPDGLLIKNYYKINNDDNIKNQIHRIMLEEILYIMNDNFLCIINI